MQTPASEGNVDAAASPDGRWLVTRPTVPDSRKSGSAVSGPGASIRVSPNGGVSPTSPFKPATFLFENNYARGGQPASYDVAADTRFLMIKAANLRASVTPVTVVLSWAEKVRALPRRSRTVMLV